MSHSFIILAYLDPGTGSIILQVILASLLAVAVAFRVFWRKLKGVFRKESPVDDADSEQDE